MRTKNLRTTAIPDKLAVALFIFAMAFFIPAELCAQVGWEEPGPAITTLYYGSFSCAAGADTIYYTQGGGGQGFYKYTISTKTSTALANNPYYGISNGGAIAWDGADYIYSTQASSGTAFSRYTISSNTWTSLAATPAGIYTGSEMIYAAGKLYVLQGWSNTGFYSYTPGGAWATLAVCPAAVNYGSALCYSSSNGLIYVLGGNSTANFWSYNIGTGAWNALNPADPPETSNTEASLLIGADTDYIYAFSSSWTGNGFKKYRISTDTWSSLTSMPLNIGEGGAMSNPGAGDWIYFTRGSYTSDMLRYSISGNKWGAVPSAPNTVNLGGSLAYYGSGNYIYALRGNSTADFWRFDTSAGTWNTGLAQPAGTVGTGGALCSDGTALYVMAGNSTTNFWKYTVGSNSWSNLTSTPGAVSTGGFLLYPGTGDYIYALRGGNFSSFWRYSISGNTWSQLTLTPNVVADGASLAYPGSGDYIYAARGANTSEFWRYSISGNTWGVLASTPNTIGIGGTIVYPKYGNYIYAMRGQNTIEFYRYNILTNVWSVWSSSPFTFYNSGMSATYANDYIYCFAGNNSTFFFRYKAFENSTPTVEGIFTNEGSTAGGTSVNITGKNFYPLATVTIGGVAATNVLFRDTGLISATAPVGVAGAADVVVTNPGPLSNTLTGGFIYKTDPIVKSVSPYSGTYTGGTDVTITGENFAVGVTVKFGANSAANVVRVSSTSITCTTPAGTGNTWSVDLIVTNPGPFNGSLKTAFRYVTVDGWDTPACAPNWFNDGSAMAYDGVDTIYALRGDNTTTFWKYSLSTNVWTACATTPGGTTLYRASSMCFANGDYIYVFRGNQTGIFWRYKISTDTWNDVDPADTTVLDATFTADYGCSMAWLGGDYIYATLGYHQTVAANRKLLLRYSISGNTWTQLASTPAEQEGGCDLVWPGQGNYIYATQGNNTTGFWRYSITGNSWETLASTPGTIKYGGSLAWAYGTNYLYLIRGNNTGGSISYFYRYSMGLNSWETMRAMPMSYGWEGGTLLSISNSDYLYAMPAYYQRDFVRYSVSRNNWVDLTPAPASIAEGGNVLYDGSANLYVCGGASTTNFWKYTLAADTWTTLAAIPATVNYGADMVLAGSDNIYLIRGTATNTFYRYTISTNTWEAAASLPNTASYGSGLAYIPAANAIYCARASSSSDFYKYDITSNSWSVMSSFSFNLNYGGSLHYPGTGDFMYMFGSNGQQTFYKYSISQNSWTQLTNAPSSFGYYPQMVYAGFGDKIYATGANYSISSTTNHAWWYYSTASNTWTTLTNTPFRYYQVTDFARANDYIYSLVGNSTPYITKYCVLDSGATPSISLINPAAGPTSGNSPVSITGTGFYPGLTLTFGGQAATNIVFNDATSLTATVPSGSAGAVNVVITNPNTKTSTLVGGFTYETKPYLTSATPQILASSGGTPVTITGSNFVSGATVSIGGVSATGVLVIDSFTITCTAPAGSAVVDLTVTNPDFQAASLTGCFEFEAANSWNEIAPLPVNAYNGLSFCYPGTGDFTYIWPYASTSTAFYRYSFSSNSYLLLAPVPTTGGYGADMIYVSSTNALYVIKGGNTNIFYRYNISSNTWDTLTACTSNVNTGGFLVYTGSGDFIYCAPGANTSTFLRYSISGNNWSPMTSCTVNITTGGSGVYPDSGDYIYAITSSNIFYRYSISGNSWLQMTNLPFSTSYGADVVFCGDGYIYGVRGGSGAEFARYNITGNTWANLTAVPVGVYRCGKMAYIPNLNAIIIIPGYNTQYVFKYYLATQRWSKFASIPNTMSYGNICGTVDKKIFVMRGQGGSEFYKYDTVTNVSSVTTTLPWGCNDGAGITQVDSTYLYVLRGYNQSSFAKFNMTTSAWTTLTDAPAIVANGGDIVYPGAGDYIYVVAGNNTSYFWRYSISQNNWQSLASTPYPVSAGGAMCYGGTRIYLSVGNSQTAFYSYDITSNAWGIESSAPFTLANGFDMAWPGYGDVIYAIQGNSTNGFWGYFTTTKSWVSLKSAPFSYGTGGFLTYGNDNYLYAITGSNGLYFSRYRLLFENLIPSITTVFPANIPVNGGMKIIIYGSNFTPTTTVKFGAVNAVSVTYMDSTRLEVIVPAGTLGLSDITVSNGSLTYTASNAVTFVSKPFVTSVTPEEGISAGKTSVTVKGYNFVSGATVTIGGTPATSVAFVDSQTLTCLTPAGTAWAASVAVTNPDVQTATLRAAFRYVQANVWSEPAPLPVIMNTGGRAQWDGNDTIYYTTGNGSTNFYKYAISTNTHSVLAVTLGTISAGSVLLYPGSGDIIYCARANNTATFWGYSISGNSWNDASYADAPVNLSTGASGVCVGTKLYFFQGNTQTEFMTYDTGTNTWDNTTPASAPATIADGGALAYPGSGDYIYAFRGSSTAEFWRYSISGNTWTVLTSAPGAVAAGGFLQFHNSDSEYLYAFQGGNVQTFWRYSMINQIWQVTSYPTNTINTNATLVSIGNSDYIYAFRAANTQELWRFSVSRLSWNSIAQTNFTVGTGGDSELAGSSIYALRGVSTSYFNAYDINTNTWKFLANTPATIATAGAIAYPGTGDYLYAVRCSNTTDFYRYSISANTWSSMASVPGMVNTGATMTATNTYIYLLQGNGVTDFWRYTIASNSWDVRASITNAPGSGADMAYPGTGDYIYVLRGAGTSELWRYSISGDSWLARANLPGTVNTGGSLTCTGTDDYIFAAAGNGSLGYYRYSISLNTWDDAAASDIGYFYDGASLNYYNGSVYAIAGSNNTNYSFWKYTASTPITVVSVTPNQGPLTGGTDVTVTGTNFIDNPATTVTFGGVLATNIIVVDALTITCTTPAGAAGNATVTVTVPGPLSASLTNGFGYFAEPAPSITSSTPAASDIAGGASVTIAGTNFVSGCSVFFGTVSISGVTFVSSSSLTLTAPAKSAGTYDMKVVNPDTQYDVLVNGFVYAVSPAVSSIAPNTGTSDGGDSVTITGTNFVSGASVKIGANSATGVTVVNSTSITCTTPSGAIGGANVVVTNPSTLSGTLTNGFTFQPVAMPDIISISPDNGDVAGNTPCTITGTDFKNGATVFFGANPAALVTWVNSTSITCSSPAGSIGAVPVKVVNPDTQYDLLFNGFTYNAPPAPQITSITPDNGLMEGGTSCTIAGSNFNSGVTVFFGTSAATSIVRVDANTITCSSPAGNAGAVSIKVTNTDAQYNILFNGYTYNTLPVPQITSISPDNGYVTGGTSCTITGSNFNSGVTVFFGANAASNVTRVDSGTITCMSPTGNAGTVTIKTVNTDTQYGLLSNGFTYNSLPAPQISSVSPTHGPIAGGTPVTISGNNFINGLIVKIGPNNATSVNVVNSSTITCLTPSVAVASTVNVTVTNPDAQSVTLTAGFTYDLSTGPAIASIYPASGVSSGGTSITVSGYNFQNGLTLKIGSSSATGVTVVSTSVVTAVTPNGTLGQANVTVTNPDGQSYTSQNGFTYISPPTITSITPDNGSVAGNIFFTITGTNFESGSTITFGGSPATGVTFVSSTVFTGYTPSGYTGKVNVVITSPSQATVTLANGFEYTGAVPAANAGSDKTSDPSVITLDGTKSTNTTGTKTGIIYQWSQVSGPEVVLSSSSSSTPSFTGKATGEYVFQLIIKEGVISSAPDSVTIKINNVSPVAVITNEETITVTEGDLVTLDAGGSYDANGDTLTFNWTFHPNLNSTAIENPVFDTAGLSGVFSFSLVVSDGINLSSPADVTIAVQDANMPPLACAGPDRNTVTGTTVYLDGSTSRDADGSIKTYLWKYLSGPSETLVLNSSNGSIAAFVPATTGVYYFSLDVTDDDNAQGLTSYVSVYANSPSNHMPSAMITTSATRYTLGQSVTLDASSSSDPDNDALTYKWELLQTEGALSGSQAGTDKTLSFTAAETGTLIYKLSVNDGTAWGVSDEITIYVVPQTADEFPVAEAFVSPETDPDGDSVVNMYDMPVVTLIGYTSTGAGTLSFLWEQKTGISVNLDDAAGSAPKFAPPARGLYEFQLTVTDQNSVQAYDNVTVIIDDFDSVLNPQGNNLPVADAGDSVNTKPGKQVALDGTGSYDSGSDSDGIDGYASGLSFSWTQLEGPVVELYYADTPEPSFTPTVNGNYKFKLTVSDAVDYSAVSYVTVVVTNKITQPDPVDGGQEPVVTPEPVIPEPEPASGGSDSSGSKLTQPACFINQMASQGHAASYIYMLSMLLSVIVVLLFRKRRDLTN